MCWRRASSRNLSSEGGPLADGFFTAEPGTPAAHEALLALPYPCLSLLHHHGTESDGTAYDSGNVEPKRGFGHIAFTTEDGTLLLRHGFCSMHVMARTALWCCVRSVRQLRSPGIRRCAGASCSSCLARPCVRACAGVGFKKKPDEGRMKGLAFALDPDGCVPLRACWPAHGVSRCFAPAQVLD